MTSNKSNAEPQQKSTIAKYTDMAMATCLAISALAVFVNVILRYGFGSGIAASEELSRLLFVWMVFIGATAAYPLGEHMAFTSLIAAFKNKPIALRCLTVAIRLLVITGAGLVAYGAWQQVVVGLSSKSVVMGYSNALLPLPALLSMGTIAVMAAIELISNKPIVLSNNEDVE